MEYVPGRSSGWQEKWPSGSGGSSGNGNGGTTTGGGFRDHSDDEDTNRRSPEDDFRDEDFDSAGFGSKKPSASVTSGGTFHDVSGSSEPKSLSFASKPTTTAAPRVKKPIDLGAAAAFAAKPPAQQQQQQPATDPYQNYNPIVADLFAADDDVSPATASHTKVVSSSLSFDADDFDPRDSANANGAFGDFSAAFSPPKSSDNQPSKVALDDGDDFADFSSAFGGGSSNPAPPSIPAAAFSPATVAPSAAPMFDLFSDAPSTEKVSTVDLLSGLDMGGGSFASQMSSGPAPSNLGGLSGLNFSPPPPLIGAHSMVLGGAPLQPQSSNSGSFFDFDSQGPMGGPQLQPHKSNNNVINSNNSMSASNSSNFSKKPTTWDTVAGVNIDLDNLKLGGKSQKKPALPMNALMTPTSSPTKGFANQPPSMMKPGTISSNNLL